VCCIWENRAGEKRWVSYKLAECLCWGLDERTEDAIAFKNRLVEYDRNAEQRTRVMDDQSDYFEIDSNAWLSNEVCTLRKSSWFRVQPPELPYQVGAG
jgi:hypothetical protein